MTLFELHRLEDVSGISGTGIVAQGVVFDDGTCVLRWLTEYRSVAFYENLVTLEKIHLHEGRTRIRFARHPFVCGFDDCVQDACENAPFASVGGLQAREAMGRPDWVQERNFEEYRRGYEAAAVVRFGADWRVADFKWQPSIKIESER